MVFQRVVQQLAVGENIHTSLLFPLINIVHHLTPFGKFQCSFIQMFLTIALLDVEQSFGGNQKYSDSHIF